MANGLGTAIIDFGSFPGTQEASIAVTGQTGISSTSTCETWIMGDDTSSNHTAVDHKYAPLFCAFTCGAPTTGVGFTIYGRALGQMTGQFTLRWVWSD